MSFEHILNVYEPIPLTPLPVVIELEGEPAWTAWDAAIRELDSKESES